MNILTENTIDKNKWEQLFTHNKFSSPFQSLSFFELFNSVSGSIAKVYATEENNKLTTLCVVTLQKEKGLKGFFSRRAIIYGGPLIAEDSNQSLQKLLSFIIADLKSETIYIEVRNYNDYSPYNLTFIKQGWQYISYLNFQLPLTGQTIQDVIANMKYNRKREIKQSLNETATYYSANDIEEVRSLYDILQTIYLQRVKLPIPTFGFFEKLYYSPIGKVFIVKHQNKIIGGAFCLFTPQKTIFTMYYCGLRNYHKKIFPTHLAILAAIEFGINNNLKMLDFMGAGKPDEEYGVRNYKAEFGGELVSHGRYIKICNPFLYRLGKFGLSILQKR